MPGRAADARQGSRGVSVRSLHERPKEALRARLAAAVPAGDVTLGTILVLDGQVLESTRDPDDAERVRLVIVPALGPPPGRNPDQRTIVISVPQDMALGTAPPENIELVPLPNRQ